MSKHIHKIHYKISTPASLIKTFSLIVLYSVRCVIIILYSEETGTLIVLFFQISGVLQRT
jgi:hypothetical protein